MTRQASRGAPIERPAYDGGAPVRERDLAISSAVLGAAAIEAAAAVMRSGWLVTGPVTERFERSFAETVGQRCAVGTTSGTAALELALAVAGIGPGDEVIVPSLTFVATAHAVARRGALPVFADIDATTRTLDPGDVARRVGPRTRAIVPVHFAGRPCDLDRLGAVAAGRNLTMIADAAHAVEATWNGRPAASYAALNAYSFHAGKNITTGEGGMLTTDDPTLATHARILRLQAIEKGYDVGEVGMKCNMADVQAAIGEVELRELEGRAARRRAVWRRYDDGLREVAGLALPAGDPVGGRHARHLYTVVVDAGRFGMERDALRDALRAERIATGLHYPPVHEFSHYRRVAGVPDGLPVTEAVARGIVSLPLHPGMTDGDADSVVAAIRRIAAWSRR